MSLIELAKNNPGAIEAYTIQQIVAICGDGKLRDKSQCSAEFREFLSSQPEESLSRYASFCLEEKFERSGFVLQDCVNEIGRRLGYEVFNGRYSGVQNDIGFDGLWFDGTNRLVVEVKTTDGFRINLDTICGYEKKLDAAVLAQSHPTHTLIVVGRQDTGDLEAQVRGSKHAWSVRLISVAALIKLMFVKSELDDPSLLDKVRRILMPFEYTRVDNIVDLVFETQQETEGKASAEAEIEQEVAAENHKHGFELTPKAELDAKRLEIAQAFFHAKGLIAQRQSKTNFADAADQIRITCAISKRYKRDYQPYWYALHPRWLEFLRGGKSAFFVLGCMDRNLAYAIPLVQLEKFLPNLNTTPKGEDTYWHIALTSDGGVIKLNLTRVGEKVDLTPFKFDS